MTRQIFKLSFLLSVFWAATASADLPITGDWNGFNNQTNIVECNNASIRNAENLQLALYRNNGSQVGSLPFRIEGRGTIHLILDNFPITNAYGMYVIDSTDLDAAKDLQIICHTAVYRQAPATRNKSVEYAFSIPASGDLLGESSGVINSIDPDGGNSPVLNWLSVSNTSSEAFSAQIEVYNQDGSLNAEASLSISGLQPKERRDYALGHPRGQVAGLYRIRPTNNAQQYRAFITRYSHRTLGGGFKFAFPLLATRGSCTPLPVVASTMDPATNWLEIANPTEQAVPVAVEIREQTGALRLSQILLIQPFSQQHVHVNSVLGDRNLGSATARCLGNGSGHLLFQSLYYGRLANGSQTEWAYASQASSTSANTRSKVVSSINTNLGAANWNIFLNTATTGAPLDLKYLTTDGVLSAERTTSLPLGGSSAYGVHQDVGPNFIGQGMATTFAANASFTAELLRVFPHQGGGLGYIMKLPSTIIDPPIGASYFRFRASDGDFIIKLTNASLINEAREILRDPHKVNRSVLGQVVPGAVDYNPSWNYSLDSESISFFEFSTEVCDATLSMVNANLANINTSFLPGGIFCPWSSRLVEEVVY